MIEDDSIAGVEVGTARGSRETVIRAWAPFIPYISVLFGIYVLHNIWIAALGYHVGSAAALVAMRFRVGERRSGGGDLIVLVANLAVGLLTGLLLYSLWPILGTPVDLGTRLAGMGLTSWAVFGIYYCAVNPFIEEALWRGSMPNDSILPTWHDALFAGYHMLVLALFMRWEWMVISFVLLVVASCLWRFSIRRKNGMLIVTASHLLADIGIVFVGLLRVALH